MAKIIKGGLKTKVPPEGVGGGIFAAGDDGFAPQRQTTTIKTPFFSRTITEAPEESEYEKARGKERAKLEFEKEPQEEFTNAQFKLIQSTMLHEKMNDWNKKNLGFDPTPALGIRGGINKVMGEMLRKNPYVNTFEGDRYTTAMALMRAIMPGRAEKMIEGVKGTLPSVWSSDQEADEQVVQSLVQALGTYISKRPWEFSEVAGDPAKVAPFIAKKEAQMRKIVNDARKLSVNIPYEAKRDDGIMMLNPEKEIEIVPYIKYTDASRDGYRPLTKEEVAKLKGGGQ